LEGNCWHPLPPNTRFAIQKETLCSCSLDNQSGNALSEIIDCPRHPVIFGDYLAKSLVILARFWLVILGENLTKSLARFTARSVSTVNLPFVSFPNSFQLSTAAFPSHSLCASNLAYTPHILAKHTHDTTTSRCIEAKVCTKSCAHLVFPPLLTHDIACPHQRVYN
jgi:hypothetical protein